MQNCHQQRKGFAEPEPIDFPRVLDTAVPSAGIGYDSYSQRNSSTAEMPGVLTQLRVGTVIGHEATGYLTRSCKVSPFIPTILFLILSFFLLGEKKEKSHHLSSGFSL